MDNPVLENLPTMKLMRNEKFESPDIYEQNWVMLTFFLILAKNYSKVPKQPKSSQKSQKYQIDVGWLEWCWPQVNFGQKLLKSAQNSQKVAKRHKKVKNTRFWPKLLMVNPV